MKLKILSVGTRAPDWVQKAYAEYAKRMPRELSLQLIEIPPNKHHKDAGKFVDAEGEKLLKTISEKDWVVCLDEHGKQPTSKELAASLKRWQSLGQDVAFVIGGSDGLAPAVRGRANETVALSSLTLPHYLVRVVVSEALYRAWTITVGHPYHRA